MRTYNFCLLISPPTVDEETAADRLYASGCGDAMFSVSGGIYEVEFDREAATLKDAVTSAMRDVKVANIGARVLRVVPDDLVNANTIAERSGKTRQAVSLWIRGERGTDFPAPITRVGQSPIWSWLTIAKWLQDRGEVESTVVEEALVISEANRVLELESQPPLAKAN